MDRNLIVKEFDDLLTRIKKIRESDGIRIASQESLLSLDELEMEIIYKRGKYIGTEFEITKTIMKLKKFID